MPVSMGCPDSKDIPPVCVIMKIPWGQICSRRCGDRNSHHLFIMMTWISVDSPRVLLTVAHYLGTPRVARVSNVTLMSYRVSSSSNAACTLFNVGSRRSGFSPLFPRRTHAQAGCRHRDRSSWRGLALDRNGEARIAARSAIDRARRAQRRRATPTASGAAVPSSARRRPPCPRRVPR